MTKSIICRTPRAILVQLLFVTCLCFTMSSVANADIIITYGSGGSTTIDLLPNTSNQTVQLFATGVAGEGGTDVFEFNVQIGDGGVDLGGSDAGPVFGSIDLITGTVWDGNGATQTDVVQFPLARQSVVDAATDVLADGLIGTIEIDTTGIFTGLVDFRVNGVAGSFDSTFFRDGVALDTTSTNGTLRIGAVPEPSTLFMLMSIGLIGTGRSRFRSPL